MLQLCLPAFIYLILAIVSIISMLLNGHLGWMVLLKVVFMAFWTWILNLICKAGYEAISWVLVLLPIILMILIFSLAIGVATGIQVAKNKD